MRCNLCAKRVVCRNLRPPFFQRVTVAASMATSDKRKTKGNREMRTKKESERKKAESKKERNAEKAAKKVYKKESGARFHSRTSVRIKPIKRRGHTPYSVLHTPVRPSRTHPEPLHPCGIAAFVGKVKYFCCLSAFKRNSDGLDSSNRPGPDSLASVASPPVFLSASPPPPSPSVASLSLCVSPVVGSRN